jgi:hypothetical protein
MRVSPFVLFILAEQINGNCLSPFTLQPASDSFCGGGYTVFTVMKDVDVARKAGLRCDLGA